MSILTPLAPFCDEYFSEIKEMLATEKTNIVFHGSDHTIGFLSFLYIDLMCYTSMLY